jgi:hypothetical protein
MHAQSVFGHYTFLHEGYEEHYEYVLCCICLVFSAMSVLSQSALQPALNAVWLLILSLNI